LKKCDRYWQGRQRLAAMYDEGFAELPEIQTPAVRSKVQHAWHLYIIQLQLERLRITRNEFIEALRQKNIGTSVHFIPLHLHPYYRNTLGHKPADFPAATAAFDRIVSLPIYPKMTDADISRVIDAVREIVKEYRR
jgi:perosamine synthetase